MRVAAQFVQNAVQNSQNQVTLSAILSIFLVISRCPIKPSSEYDYCLLDTIFTVHLNAVLSVLIWTSLTFICFHSTAMALLFIYRRPKQTDIVAFLASLPIAFALSHNLQFEVWSVKYVYYEWAKAYANLIQFLGMFPAVAIVIQTTAQSLLLFSAFLHSFPADATLSQSIQITNLTLLIHNICMLLSSSLDSKLPTSMISVAAFHLLYRIAVILIFRSYAYNNTIHHAISEPREREINQETEESTEEVEFNERAIELNQRDQSVELSEVPFEMIHWEPDESIQDHDFLDSKAELIVSLPNRKSGELIVFEPNGAECDYVIVEQNNRHVELVAPFLGPNERTIQL